GDISITVVLSEPFHQHRHSSRRRVDPRLGSWIGPFPSFYGSGNDRSREPRDEIDQLRDVMPAGSPPSRPSAESQETNLIQDPTAAAASGGPAPSPRPAWPPPPPGADPRRGPPIPPPPPPPE